MPAELPTLVLANAALWRQWLAREGLTANGVWLTLAKKGTSTPTSLTYSQALDEALCYGWIDGQARRGDEKTYCQRFTPRTAKSLWSKRNVGHIARLEGENRMQEAGRAAVEKAKADGRWEAAYAGSADAQAPPDFLAALAAIPTAMATWEGMNKTNRYAVYLRLKTLKTPAGRERRIAAYVDLLAKGDVPPPPKGVKGPASVAKSAAVASVFTTAQVSYPYGEKPFACSKFKNRSRKDLPAEGIIEQDFKPVANPASFTAEEVEQLQKALQDKLADMVRVEEGEAGVDRGQRRPETTAMQ